MEKFKDLVSIVDLTLNSRSITTDADTNMELFNADLEKLFPASEGYKIKRFYPEGEFVFDIHGESTWQIRVKVNKLVDTTVELSIIIMSSNILTQFFQKSKETVYFPESRCYNSPINSRRITE